jgi:hypothetical protein
MSDEQQIGHLIRAIEAEYDPDSGFLGLLRQGIFDPAGFERLITLLESVKLSNQSLINRRLVALLWMIPTFMSWQEPRVAERGGDIVQLQHRIDKVQTLLYPILGVP